MVIDREKLRAFVRRLDGHYLRMVLDRAMDRVPDDQLFELVKDMVHREKIETDEPTEATLLMVVEQFHGASVRGEYYQEFRVNGRNCTEFSGGTETWIAECHRLLDRCVEAASSNAIETQAAFERIFDLLQRIDRCEDIVFFADEHGAWQVNVQWKVVMPAYFECVSRTALPEEFADTVIRTILHFDRTWGQDHAAAARKVASEAQQKALDARNVQFERPFARAR